MVCVVHGKTLKDIQTQRVFSPCYVLCWAYAFHIYILIIKKDS